MKRSAMFETGHILLLVGGIMQITGALMAVAVAWYTSEMAKFAWLPPGNPLPSLVTFYVIIATLNAIGGVLAFIGFSASRRGNARAAFGWGLAGSLVPPVQVITLVGAILCRVSPEGEQLQGLPQTTYQTAP